MMNKPLPSLLLAGATLLGASHAFASVPLGDGAEAFLTLKAGVDYNDNLFLSTNNADSDTILRLTPGIDVLFGQNSLAQVNFSYTEQFNFYSDNSAIDASLSTVKATLAYDDEKTKVDARAGYQQLDQATRDLRGAGLVKREIVDLGLTGEINLTAKTSAKLGIAYNDTDYARATYADWEYFQIPLNYYYEVAPKLDASFGFTYKENAVGNAGVDTKEYFYNVGARGEMTPKLTGEVKIGFAQSKPSFGSTRETVGIDSSVLYAYSEKTSFDVNVANGFGFSGTGDGYRTLTVGGGVSSNISEQLQLGARLSYSNYAYSTTTQDDDTINASLSATYKYNEMLSFMGSYAYTDNSSNLAGASYSSNVLSLSASLRY